ncbi:MAG: glutamate 5-kinase [Bacteroidota bacterium]
MSTQPSHRYHRLVVKLGTSVLTGGTPRLDRAHMVEIVRQCADLHRRGFEVIICTSGAIAAGRERLGHPDLPSSITTKQMLAAVGQSRLIQVWEHLFELYDIPVGQVLLTRADVHRRGHFLNARDTLRTLLEHRIIPIINENDAVANTEIRVGDNDNLSALAVLLTDADLLLLMTDQAGLYTSDPRTNPYAELIAEVRTIDRRMRKLAGGSVSGQGVGGMRTKLQAARIAQRAGADVVIAAGRETDVVLRIVEGERIGTRFPAKSTPLQKRKRWILGGKAPAGRIIVDAGAVHALVDRGSSLLPAGVQSVDGVFHRGDSVTVSSPEGEEIARGLVRYGSAELHAIKGLRSDQIVESLGYSYGPVAVHRNDLIILNQ